MNPFLSKYIRLEALLLSAALRTWPLRDGELTGENFPGVYALYWQESLIYIGQSCAVLSRLRDHANRMGGARFDGWRAVEIPDDYQRRLFERFIIRKCRPVWNGAPKPQVPQPGKRLRKDRLPYWLRRVFRQPNFANWFVKISAHGVRHKVTLQTPDHEVAAKLALELYWKIRALGWEAARSEPLSPPKPRNI